MAVAMPTLIAQCAFTTAPTAAPTWTDLSPYVRTITTNRGRQFELDRMMTGTADILFNNQDRRFDPNNASSPYTGGLLPKRRIRLQATWASVTYPIFDGYVDAWPQGWVSNGRVAQVDVTANDAFSIFGQAALNTVFQMETADVRVGHVLDAINWGAGVTGIIGDPVLGLIGSTAILGPVGGRNIGASTTILQASTLSNTTALEHLMMTGESESGLLFMSRDGLVTFIGRNSLSSTNFATFGDGVGEFPYGDLELTTSPVFNDIRLTATGGEEQVAVDSLSQHDYFFSSKTESGYLQQSDSDLNSLTNYLLAQYKDPRQRVSSISIMPSRSPAVLWPQVLGREIGDRITVNRRPPGGGAVISQQSVIQGIQHTGSNSNWTTIFSLSPVPVSVGGGSYLIIGTGLVDSGIVGF